MEIDERINGLAIMAENMKKLDPSNFSREPVSGFIDALAADFRNIADGYIKDEG